MSQRTFSIANFDLVEYIRDFKQPEVAREMAQGLAWKIDTMLQQTARLIFKHVRDDLFKRNVDGLAELTIALREAEFAGTSFAEAGSAVTGPVQTIGELWHFRDTAHNVAKALTSLCLDWQGRPMHYEIPDIEDVFLSEVKMRIKPETQRRLAISTQRRAKAWGLGEDEVKAQIAKKIERKEQQLRDVGMALEDQAPAVFELFTQALKRRPDGEVHFWSLDVAVQRQLIEQAMTNADRAEDRATDNTNLTDSEFDDVCMAVLQATKDFKEVLASPRFVTQQQTEDAVA